MRNNPIVRRLVVLVATSGLLAAAFFAATPAVTAFNPHPPCTSVDLSSNQTANPGQTVTLTASSTGCNQPAEYRFYLQAPGGSWSAQGAYSSTATFAWNTTGLNPGDWGIGVRARASGTTVAYDSYYTGTFTLWIPYCGEVSVSPNPTSPLIPGQTVVFTAKVLGFCGTPEFRFLLLPPGGSWKTARAYNSSATFSWNTTGLAAGTWQIGVWARETGSKHSYDAYVLTTYVLLTPNCPFFVMAAPSVPSPQVAGTSVVFGMSTATCYGTTVEVQFLTLAPGGVWTVVQPYSTTYNYTWDTTGLANGRYQIGLWVKAFGSPKRYDDYRIITYYIGT